MLTLSVSAQRSSHAVSMHCLGVRLAQVIPCQLPSGKEAAGRVRVSKAGGLFISESGRHVGIIDKNSLFVWAAGNSTTGKRKKLFNLPHTKPYTVRVHAECQHALRGGAEAAACDECFGTNFLCQLEDFCCATSSMVDGLSAAALQPHKVCTPHSLHHTPGPTTAPAAVGCCCRLCVRAVCRIRYHRQRHRSRRCLGPHPDLAQLPAFPGPVGQARQRQHSRRGGCWAWRWCG